MNHAALIRMRRRLANLSERHSDVPELADLAADQDDYERRVEQRVMEHQARVYEQIIIDPIEDDSLDGGRMTCTLCGLSSDHESMAAAGASGWLHAQGCGGQR